MYLLNILIKRKQHELEELAPYVGSIYDTDGLRRQILGVERSIEYYERLQEDAKRVFGR